LKPRWRRRVMDNWRGTAHKLQFAFRDIEDRAEREFFRAARAEEKLARARSEVERLKKIIRQVFMTVAPSGIGTALPKKRKKKDA